MADTMKTFSFHTLFNEKYIHMRLVQPINYHFQVNFTRVFSFLVFSFRTRENNMSINDIACSDYIG